MQTAVLLKKISTPLLAVFIAASVFLAGPVQADELTKEERDYLTKKGEVVFISQTHYPPFEFIGQDGDHTGMCIELVRWIATRFGFRARFIDTSFKQAQEAVLNGKADVITSLFYSQKRDHIFDFTQMMFLVPASIFVKADRPDINGIEDLNGKTIAMQAGDYAQEFLESKNIKFKVAWTKNFAQATDLVIAGKADAIIGDEQIVLYHLYSNHLTRFIKKVGEPLYIGQNCMGVKQGQQILQSILNKGIALAKETGTLDRINTTWLGVHYQASESYLIKYRYYLLAGIGLIVMLALLAWFWNVRLRTVVAQRTQTLARSERSLQTILARSPLGIVLVKNRILVWENEAMRTMLGYGPGELDGQDADILFPTIDEYWLADSKIIRALRAKDNIGVETRCKRKNGHTFDCLLHSSVLDQDDRDASIIIIAQDISYRKRAAEALKESEKRFRKFTEQSPLGVALVDEKGNYNYINPAFVKMFGYNSTDIKTGKDWFKLAYPDKNYRKSAIKTWENDRISESNGDPRPRTFEVKCKNGEEKIILFRAIAIPSLGQYVIYEDITDRKRAENALIKSENKYRMLAENISDVIWTIDKDFKITYCSPSIEKLRGFTPEEVVGKGMDYVGLSA